MSGEEISPELKRFIQNTINSVEQLEVLLFMVSNPEREWSAAEICERVRLPEASVLDRLNDLCAARLLTCRLAPEPHYRYAPESSALAKEVAESLDKAYRERKDTILQLVFSRPLDNIRVFADAFRLKRKE